MASTFWAVEFFILVLAFTAVSFSTAEDSKVLDALCKSDNDEDSRGLSLLQMRLSSVEVQGTRAAKVERRLSGRSFKQDISQKGKKGLFGDPEPVNEDVAQDAQREEHFDNRIEQEDSVVKAGEMKAKLKKTEADAKIQRFKDRASEVKTEKVVSELKNDLKEGLSKENITRLEDQVAHAQQDVLEDKVENAGTREKAEALKNKLQDAKSAQVVKEQEEEEEAAKMIVDVIRLREELATAKDAQTEELSQHRVRELADDEDVKELIAKVQRAEAQLRHQKSSDAKQEAEVANNIEASFSSTAYDGSGLTCDGTASGWGKEGHVLGGGSLDDCQDACARLSECKFIQFEASCSRCHLYQTCTDSRKCESGSCERTLERHDV